MELKKSGLPIALEKNRLAFKNGLNEVVPDIRTLEQMKPVLLFKQAKSPREFYYMYRNICLQEHEKKIFESNLRFDITLIPPATIGKEFVKTLGHYHQKVPRTNTYYPEVYEVISGTAHYLLQKESDCILVQARLGEKTIMFPGYGHITINPSSKPLVIANWVEKNFKSIYGPIKEKGGGMYFETIKGWVKNENYKTLPKIRVISPADFEDFGLTKSVPLYSLVHQIEKLDFLKHPQNYFGLFEKFLNK